MTAAVLHLLWWAFLASGGGDLAAQDAWAEFARVHPDSAYNLAWYGGMHPVSYSVISPYVMAVLGVRTTMIVAGTVSAGLLALLLVRSKAVTRPWWPSMFGALAITGNAVSGRATFGLGMMFGLAALAVVFAWPARWRTDQRRHRWPRAALAAALSAMATAGSPVAGLFIGIVAAALWLERRRPAAYVLGLPPVAVVALSSWLFPFSGQQPMSLASAILPLAFGVGVCLLAPPSWRTVRIGAAVYAVGVLAVWVVPSQIGTNMTRLSLIFGGVLLVALVVRVPDPQERRAAAPTLRLPTLLRARRGRVALALVAGIITSSIWQVAVAARDVINTQPTDSWTADVRPLVRQLRAHHAELARVEVVPAASHREASALAPYVNLARGWNRQADAERNPLFYTEGMLTPTSYHRWLDRWAVHFVVLPTGEPDHAAVGEAQLVAGGLRYLRQVWSDPNWRLYAVRSPTPVADPPAVVTAFGSAEVTVSMPRAGNVLVRIPDSPWLSLVDEQGQPVPAPTSSSPDVPPLNTDGCLSPAPQPFEPGDPQDVWTTLRGAARGHLPDRGAVQASARHGLPRRGREPEPLAGAGHARVAPAAPCAAGATSLAALRGGPGTHGPERLQVVGAGSHHAPGRLRHLAPRAGQVAQRLGDHQARLVAQLLEHLHLRVQRPQLGHPCRVVERARLPDAGVAERPDGGPVRGRRRHLDRVLDAVPRGHVLDEPDRPLDGRRRVLGEPERQGEVEEQLGVRRALDVGEERRVHRQHQVALDLVEARDGPVVHPQPVVVPERVTVAALHRRARSRPGCGRTAAAS